MQENNYLVYLKTNTMIKNIFAALAVVAVLASCKSQSAFKYNQDFVGMEKSLTPAAEKAQLDMQRYMMAKQFDSIAVVATQMENKVEEKIAEIKKTPAPDANGGEKFKASVIGYFGYMKNLYTTYKDLGNAKTDEARQAEALKLQEIAMQGEAVIRTIKVAQQEYAKANNFRIEEQH
jgi:hypothetical protein